MNCKNCNTNLSEASDYCYSCGGKVIRNRLTTRNLFDHFTETFFNYDNKIFQTFINLFKKPEDVIGTYIDGTRKRYVDVISYFAIALTISGIQIFLLNKFFPEAMNVDQFSPKGMESFQRKNMSFTQEYQSIIYMLMVPLYALSSKIIFFDYKTYNYTEHIVINMYLSAHFAIVSAACILIISAFGVNFAIGGLILVIFQIIYSAFAFKRLFSMSFSAILIKTILFLLLLGILFVAITIVSAFVMYLSGDLDAMIEAQRAAKQT